MANTRQNDVRKTASNLNSRWLQNTLKSMGVAGTQVIKDLMPATSETFSSGSKLAAETARSIRNTRAGGRNIQNAISSNQVVKMGQEFFKNAIEDIKSGNIYNTDRVGSSDMDDLETVFDDIDNMFDDENTDVNIENNIVQSGNDSATIKAVQQQTEYQLKASKATVDTMVSVASATIMKTSELGTKVLSELATINRNLAAMIEYNNTNMTKFIEASIGYYEQMASSSESSSGSSSSRVNQDNIYGSSGGLDFSNYKEYVKGNIKALKEDSLIGSTVSMIIENKDAFISNPLGEMMKAVMNGAIPQVMKSSMKALDESVKDFIPVMLERIGSLAENDNSMFSGISRTISKVFGIKTERKTEFDTSKIIKGPIPYNGMANHTIIEIIPKYLRESNTYLKEIAETITGKSSYEMSKGFTGFDWETGKFKSIEDLKSEVFDQIIDTVTSTFENSNFGKKLSSRVTLLENDDEKNKYDDALKQFYVAIEKHKGIVNFNNPDHIKELIDEGISSSDNIKNLIKASIQDMIDTNSELVGNAYATKQKATRKKDQSMRSFEENANDNNLHQIFDGETVDHYSERKFKNASISGHNSPSKLSLSVPSLLQGIQDTLNRGIYVTLKPSLSSSSTSSIYIPESSTNSSRTVDNNNVTNVDDYKAKIAEEDSIEFDDVEFNQNDGIRQRFGKSAAKQMNSFTKVLNGIMSGNADKAWDEFISGIGNVFKKASGFLSEHFLSPMKKTLFGEKNDNGYIKGGIFEGVNNRFKESFFSLRRMITGKGYIDSQGNAIEDVSEDDMGNTVVGKLKNMLTGLKDSISVRLFGDKESEDEDKKEGVIGKAKKGLSDAVSSFMKGLTGWKTALFGEKESENPEEEGKKIWEDIKKKASDVLPSALAGSVVGATGGTLAGGILGHLVGGPIGGALLGFAGGILSKSDKFNNWLFGEEKNGERTGGVISKQVQDYVKKNGKFLAGGAAIGAIKGTISGGGILGTLVGGPIAGALMGIGTSMILKSEMFHKFLYGDEEAGQLGLFKTVKSMFGSFRKSSTKNASDGKLLGMAGIGAGVGAITLGAISKAGILGLSLGPAGPIGGALLGLGASMLAQKDNFHEWLFGKTDKDGNKKEGILGKFKNMIVSHVIHPLGNTMKSIGRDFKTFLQYDVLDKFNLIIEPIGKTIFGSLSKLTGTAIDSVSGLGTYIKENFLQNVIDTTKNVLSPLTTAVSTVSKGIYTASKKILAAPLNIMYAITSPITQSIGAVVGGTAKVLFKTVDIALIKPVKYLILKPLGKIITTTGQIVAAPFKLLGRAADKITDIVHSGMDHIHKFTARIASDFKKAVITPVIEVVKKPFVKVKEFTDHLKDTVAVMISPVTDFVKAAVDEVKNGAKRLIKSAFSKIFGFITSPFRLLGRGIKGLLGIGKNKQGEGYFSRIWRETGKEGYRPDHSDDIEGSSNRERRKYRKEAARIAYEENRKKNREDRLRSQNEKLIAKYTNYQRFEDTEENRKLAEMMSGKKIKFNKIDAVESKNEKLQASITSQTDATHEVVDETRENTNVLKKIYNFLHTALLGSPEEREKLKNEARFLSDQEGTKATEEEHQKNQEDAIIEGEQAADITQIDTKSAKDKAKKRISENRKNRYARNYKKYGFIGGLKENFSILKTQMKSGLDKLDKHQDGTDSAEAGLAIVGEKGVEAVYSKNSKFGKLVGLNGPEVINMKGGETVIPNSRIAKFEDGTKDQDKFDHSNMSDENLERTSDEKKLTVSERIIKCLLAIKDSIHISSYMNKMEKEGYEDTTGESEYDTTNIDKIKNAFKRGGKSLLRRIPGYGLVRGTINLGKNVVNSGKILVGAAGEAATIASDKVKKGVNKLKDNVAAIGSVVSSKFHDNEEEENQARIENAKNAQTEVTGLTGEKMRALRAAEREEESDDDREDAKLSALQNLVIGQKEHSSVWNSIFSKKGLITGLIIAAIPLLIKLFKNLPDWLKNLGSTISSWAGNAIEHFLNVQDGGLGDGKSSIDKIGDEIEEFQRVGSDLSKGNIIGATKNFLFDEDGNVYNETGARAKLLTKGVSKGISKIVGVTTKGKIIGKILSGTADDASKALLTNKSTKLGSKVLTKWGKNHIKFSSVVDDALKSQADNVAVNVTKTLGDDAAKALTKNATLALPGTVGNATFDAMGNIVAGSADDVVGATLKSNADDIVKNSIKTLGKNSVDDVVGATVKSSIDDVVATASKGLLDDTITLFKGFIDDFFKAISKAGSKVASSTASSLVSKVIDAVKTHFGSISKKVGDVLTATAGLAATGVGLLAKEATWVTLGALNGLSGAKRLFRTDDVDALMVTISSALGAFNGTTVGSICDIINELIVSVLGIDVYTELASLVYGILAGKRKAEALANAQKDFEEKYDGYRAAKLTEQYNTMQKAQLLDSNVTLEDYIEGAKDGVYASKYKSFADYNDDQHKTFAANIGDGLLSVGRGVVKAGKTVREFLFGSSETVYEDKNRNIYRKNDDGTYQVTSADGENLGYISKDALPSDVEAIQVDRDGSFVRAGKALKNFGSSAKKLGKSAANAAIGAVETIKDSASNLWNGLKETAGNTWEGLKSIGKKTKDGIKNFFTKATTTGWMREDGSYYDSTGQLYSASGDKIGEPIDLTDLSTLISSGQVIETEITTRESGFKKTIDSAKGLLTGAWTTVKDKASSLWNGIKEKTGAMWDSVSTKLSETGTNIKNFLLPHTEKRWHSTEGGYYQSNGSTFDYYNDNGDLITTGISADAFQELCLKGVVTADDAEEVTVNATVVNKFKEIGGIVKDTFSGFTDAAIGLWTNLKETAGSVINEIKDKGISSFVGGLFKSKKDTGWYCADGSGYYKLQSNGKYNKYNLNGDVIEEGIESSKIEELNAAGLLTEGTIETDSAAQKAIKDIKGAVREAWDKAKDTVKNGWNRFKNWITGGSGVGTHLTNYSQGDVGIIDESITGGSGYGLSRNNYVRGGKGENPTIVNGHAYYSQNDSRWANRKFVQSNGYDDGATMSNSGCGPTAMSMVISDMKGKTIDPVELAQYAQFSGNRDETGTNWNFIDSAAYTYGLDTTMSYRPSKSFIKANLKNGNPMILSGQDDGSGNTPYTSAGHYIVAVGMDSNGNIIYNDPRGKSYSGRKDINDVLGNTSVAWSFSNTGRKLGAFGRGIKKIGRGIANFVRGGRGNNSKWIAIVQAVKKAIASQKPGYSQTTWIKITVGGVTKSVRTDCSGLVAACCKYYGVISDSTNLYSGNMLNDSSPLKAAGFTRKAFSSWDNLEIGDVLVKSGHTEIYAGKKNGSYYVYNCGSDSSVNNSGATGRSNTSYTVVWKPGNPGTSCITGLNVSDTTYSSCSSEDRTNTDIGSEKYEDPYANFFTNVASGYAKLASTAWGAILSGNYDTDWSKVFSDEDTSLSDSSGSVSSTNVSDVKDANFKGKSIRYTDIKSLPHMSVSDVTTILKTKWADHKNSIFTQSNSASSAQGIVQAQEETGVSSIIPLSIGALESGWGTSSIARNKGNLWGWAAYNSNPYGSATTFGSNQYSAFKQYTNNLVSTYYDKYGAHTINAIGTGDNPAGKGYAYNDDGSISTTWAPQVTSCGERMIGAINGGSGDGATIKRRKYVGSEENILPDGGRGTETYEPVKSAIPVKTISEKGHIGKFVDTHINLDNSTLEGLMGQVVQLLTVISTHSGNLDLLKDIKSNINQNNGNNIVTNVTNNVVDKNGKKTSQSKTASGSISPNEQIARRIAFGV